MNENDELGAARHRVERSAEGLRYRGEAPFTWVHFPEASGDGLRAAAVARLLAVPEAEVEERTIEDFLAPHIEAADRRDPDALARIGLYRVFRDMLHKEVHGVRAYRTRTDETRWLLLGRLPDGSVGGVETRESGL